MISLVIIILFSYLLGSVPTGYLFGKIFKGIDIREIGSGSTGATNVKRLLGLKLAVVVLLIDIIKGLLSVLVVSRINLGDLSLADSWLMMIAGFSAVMGHVFPIWIGFKGGKGIGTAAGMLIGILPLETAFALLVFIVVVTLTRYISLGSMVASLFILIALLAERIAFGNLVEPAHILFGILLFIIIIITHRQNIARLLSGNENKFRLGEKT